jgi:hypothetical protein
MEELPEFITKTFFIGFPLLLTEDREQMTDTGIRKWECGM